ncbi:MAG: hypothetical protein J1E95_05640 [Muribaculaceae bacterium]|nr:hypothetical protein [Muribaculaceae bacterium]
MKRTLLPLLVLGAIAFSCKSPQQQQQPAEEEIDFVTALGIPECVITTPPDSLNLDPWYKKYVDVNGIPLCSSWRCPDSALVAGYNTLYAMTSMLSPEIMDAMRRVGTRVTMMARYEGTTDVPEHRHLAEDTTLNWDLRARGLGGDMELPLTSCAEENVLGYQIDKYHAEDILIHEFAHSIHLIGILQVEPDINDRLQALLDNAIQKGLWRNTYRETDVAEYFAEGVQDWFNVNAEMDHPDGKHNYVNTREELKERDPGLYDLLALYFPATDRQISRHKYVNVYTKENSRTN